MKLRWQIHRSTRWWEVWTDGRYDELDASTTPAWVWELWKKINTMFGWNDYRRYSK